LDGETGFELLLTDFGFGPVERVSVARGPAVGRVPFRAEAMGQRAEDHAWRQRPRARGIEAVNAGCRNRERRQVPVRGLTKMRAASSWQAMSHNAIRILRTEALAAIYGRQPHRLA